MVHRVRALLLREQRFQDSFVDANLYGPVNYEGLEIQPFDSIRPLFRAPDGAYPIGDQAYDSAWTKLMIEFGEFYRAATGEQHVRMVRLKPRLNPDGTPVIRSADATNRQGVLELSDVAELLGHRDVVVTAHYTKPSGQTLRDQLQESDAAIVADYSMFDASSEIHIRADRPESALVRSFSRDRKETIARFRFMGPIALWSSEDSKGEGDGLRLLTEGPMSRIRFRERTELVLQRIADSNAYPTLSTPQVQAAAGRLRRRLLAGRKVDEIETWTDDFEELRSTAQMLSIMLKASGKSMSEVAALADAPTSTPSEPLLLPRIGYGS